MNLPTLESASTLDPAYYLDPAWYAFDLQQIHAANWQIMAPASQLSEPGDLVVREIAGTSVILLRNQKGLAGFLNICAHRGGPLATTAQNSLTRLTCGYHGWTYNLTGELRKAPGMEKAKGFDMSCINLTSIDVQEKFGLVFARLKSGPPLDQLFEGISEITGSTPFDGFKYHSTKAYPVAANWKLYVDNFVEGYHLPFVHPGLTQAVDFASYETKLGNYWSLQRSPVPADMGAYAAGEGLYFFIYPNTMLNIMPGRLQTNRVVPTGKDSCEVQFDFYYTDDQAFRAEADAVFSAQVQEEDRRICEHVQMSYESGRYQPGRLSPAAESGVWHWHNLLRRVYAGHPFNNTTNRSLAP